MHVDRLIKVNISEFSVVEINFVILTYPSRVKVGQIGVHVQSRLRQRSKSDEKKMLGKHRLKKKKKSV